MVELEMQKIKKFILYVLRKMYYLPAVILIGAIIFAFGYGLGFQDAYKQANQQLDSILSKAQPSPAPSLKPSPLPTTKTLPKLSANYSGPELWAAVNKARQEHGVSTLSQRDILCTIAAIRLSQIRELGKLDGHDGFQAVFDKYKDNPEMPTNISEFLISGYPTPDQAVEGWLNTLGHKKLITGGEYVWGCIYAADSFGVAITGY